MSDGLPQGWAGPLLGEVVTIKQGNSKLTKKIYATDGKYIAFSGSGPDGKLDTFEHEGKAIVLSAVGARCGKCFRAEGKWTAIANTAIIRPLCDDDDHYDYLFYLLNNEDFWTKGGTAQPFVQTGVSQREIAVPIPPLAEQRRIVAKLEVLLGKVDACRARLDKIPVLLKRFRQSVLAAACSGRLTADWREANKPIPVSAPSDTNRRRLPLINETELLFEIPKTWCWCRLGTVASLINGDRGKQYPNRTEYVAKGIPFINTGHIRPDGSLSAETMHFLTRSKFDSLRSGKIREGDLVYCLRGATLGKTAFVQPYSEGAIASSLVIIRLHEQFDSRLLYYYLTSSFGKALIDRFDNGSAQPNLSADSVKQYVVPMPPPAEQKEIVRRVEALFAVADAIEERFQKAKAQVEKLTPSLLAKAFRGEIVPQDPNDEPASVLLERIRGQAPATEPRKRRNDS